MKIEFKNKQLSHVIQMLMTVETKGKYAISLHKFTEMVNNKNNELSKDELFLVGELCKIDDNGNPKIDSNGSLIALEGHELSEFVEARNDLFEKNCVIDLSEFSSYIDDLKKAIDETDTTFSGANLNAYATLREQLEGVEASAVH